MFEQVQVAIILGSKSDEKYITQLDPNKPAAETDARKVLRFCGVSSELSAISTHRNAAALADYCANVRAKVLIAAASGSAGLPGAIAGLTNANLPILGVALPRPEFPDADDALKSMLYMPPGTPVAVCGVGNWGMTNAMIVACQIVARCYPEISAKLAEYREATNKLPSIAYAKE